jgi:hypothetical protein
MRIGLNNVHDVMSDKWLTTFATEEMANLILKPCTPADMTDDEAIGMAESLLVTIAALAHIETDEVRASLTSASKEAHDVVAYTKNMQQCADWFCTSVS